MSYARQSSKNLAGAYFERVKRLTFCVASPEGLFLLDQVHIDFADTEGYQPMQASHFHHLYTYRNACIEFMEAHTALQCLAWPMEQFFSEHQAHPDLQGRIDAIIERLSRTLLDLRVETLFRSSGEPRSDNVDCPDLPARQRRRLFIERFASKMKNLESIKIEGGVPRDEKREIVRALHGCPLKKVVMIGVTCPFGNTWGPIGQHLDDHSLSMPPVEGLEDENRDAINEYSMKAPVKVTKEFRYE